MTVKELERQLIEYSRKKKEELSISEKRVVTAVKVAENAFFESDQICPMSGREFLISQISFIQKRWWGMQFLVLLLMWMILMLSGSDYHIRRCMGVLAPVFVILLLPELWKNRSCKSLEVEAAACFSLRHVYAARIFAFGTVDMVLLSLFGGVSVGSGLVEIRELLFQFLLPLSVTAGICFHSLCSRWCNSVSTAVVLCFVWTSVWYLIVLNEKIYTAISVQVWSGMLLLAAGYLAYSVGHVWKSSDRRGLIYGVENL